jgi:hypothetical protein
MAPKDAAVRVALGEAVREIFFGPKRDEMTANQVRRLAEEKLGLEEGLLGNSDWKAKSKEMIKAAHVRSSSSLSHHAC